MPGGFGGVLSFQLQRRLRGRPPVPAPPPAGAPRGEPGGGGDRGRPAGHRLARRADRRATRRPGHPRGPGPLLVRHRGRPRPHRRPRRGPGARSHLRTAPTSRAEYPAASSGTRRGCRRGRSRLGGSLALPDRTTPTGPVEETPLRRAPLDGRGRSLFNNYSATLPPRTNRPRPFALGPSANHETDLRRPARLDARRRAGPGVKPDGPRHQAGRRPSRDRGRGDADRPAARRRPGDPLLSARDHGHEGRGGQGRPGHRDASRSRPTPRSACTTSGSARRPGSAR